MKKIVRSTGLALEQHFEEFIKPARKSAPWALRLTEHADKPAPVLIVKEYRRQGTEKDSSGRTKTDILDRGLLYGEPLNRLLPVLRKIVSGVRSDEGIPLELQRYLEALPLNFRGNLPLDEEAGYKLALIFRLQERLKELDRVELLARRAEKFSREEAAYWFSRLSDFGPDASRWAQSGLRIMLAGQPGDPTVAAMLDKLRRI